MLVIIYVFIDVGIKLVISNFCKKIGFPHPFSLAVVLRSLGPSERTSPMSKKEIIKLNMT